MKALVIYATRYGNTRAIAEAIANGLASIGTAATMPVTDATRQAVAEADVVVIGGPTEGHGMTPPVKALLASLSRADVNGKPAAAFDTRLGWPAWLAGSAGARISNELRKAGASIVVPTESFIVSGNPPVLEPGELARAGDWGKGLAREISARSVPAGV